MRCCTKCKVEKEDSEFRSSKHAKSGLQSWCKTCSNKATLARHRKRLEDPVYVAERRERNRTKRYEYLYGISIGERDEMFLDQSGCCFICDKPLVKGKNCVVDHDHKTGRVRKLLCVRCNTLVAPFEDQEFVRKVNQYLKLHENREARKR